MHISFILNQNAGQSPVPDEINALMQGSEATWTVDTLKSGEDAAALVGPKIGQTDIIAVYGGDGTVTQAASALIGKGTPLAIIPGGTANVLSKELKIPQDTAEAIKLLRDGKYTSTRIDTDKVNGTPFLLRVNLGIMAEMVTNIDPDLKDKIGQVAYGVSAVKSIANADKVLYKMNIDGKEIETEGVSLTITNSGSVGIGNWQMQPGISLTDGLLDVILLKDAGILSLIKATGASLFDSETDTIAHWACRKISIKLPGKTLFLCDDCETTADELHIEVVPSSLTVIVPQT